MQLYLVQHGAAKSEAEDPQRSLTAEGMKTVERMAQHLASLKLHLDRIEHSDKQRARQTAEIMAAHLRPAEGTRQVAGLAPNDDIGPMRERLQNESKSLMIVGHLPYLSRLLSTLLGAQQDRTLVTFRMGGVVHLVREDAGEWRLRWILVPELLPERTAQQQSAASSGLDYKLKNMLVTGRPGVGKTSVVEAVAREFPQVAGGFTTSEIREHGVRQGFRVITWIEAPRFWPMLTFPGGCELASTGSLWPLLSGLPCRHCRMQSAVTGSWSSMRWERWSWPPSSCATLSSRRWIRQRSCLRPSWCNAIRLPIRSRVAPM